MPSVAISLENVINDVSLKRYSIFFRRVGEFPSTNVRQCGIHLPGKVVLYRFLVKVIMKSLEIFIMEMTLHSFIKISTLASESGSLFFWTEDPFFLPVVINMSLLSA